MRRRSSARDIRHVEANVSRAALLWLVTEAECLFQFAPGVTPGELQQTAIAELGLVAWLLRQWKLRGKMRADDAGAADVLQKRIGSAYARAELNRYAFEGPPEAFIGQLFMRLGAGTAAERAIGKDVIRRLIEERNILALERSPARMLELRFVLDALGLAHDLPSRRALVDLGILGRPLNVDALWPSSIYSITHVIFFATSYGARTSEVFSSDDLATLDTMTSRLVENVIGLEHWDLLAELILTRKCLGLAGPLHTAAWQALATAQCSDGSFGPAASPARNANRQDLAGVKFRLALTKYHKCLVAALAGYFRPVAAP